MRSLLTVLCLVAGALPAGEAPVPPVGDDDLADPAIAAERAAPVPDAAAEALAPGPRWRPVEPAWPAWETAPGGALDLSALVPAPLPGRLVASGSHLVLEDRPGVRVRLLGNNLCFSANFPDHALAERMARAMRAQGYNAVRLHHHDGGLVRPGGDGTELDPEKLDRLDYLVAQCKAQGLWFTTDLYVSRTLPRGAIPELPDLAVGKELKFLTAILPSAMANWKRFATNLLGHRNPYTGLTWAEEPALATLGLVNEDTFSHGAWERSPRMKALFEQRFEAWLAGRGAAPADADARAHLRLAWLRELQAARYADMRSHVRALGVRAPLTDCNFRDDWWGISARDDVDVVDLHAYHDHPHFPEKAWALPIAYEQHSPVAGQLWTPLRLSRSRRLDRPFTITELAYVFPNHRRAQYAAGIAAAAGLQDWDGLWRFNYARDLKVLEGPGPIVSFDSARDPIAQLADRAVALIWGRGDLAPAPWAAALAYDPAVAAGSRATPPAALARLALSVRVGTLPAAIAQQVAIPGLRCLLAHPEAGAAPAGRLPVVPCDGDLPAALAEAGLAMPADGPVAIDPAAGILTLATARSVAAVLPGGAVMERAGVAIANRDADEATVVLAALDGDLADGGRLLLLHLTDAQNQGQRFADRTHTRLRAWGEGPVLVRAGAIAVRLPGRRPLRAWALDAAGTRREEIALAANGDGWRLDAGVVRAWGPCLAWELVRE